MWTATVSGANEYHETKFDHASILDAMHAATSWIVENIRDDHFTIYLDWKEDDD